MKESITSYVGLNIHRESIAMAIADRHLSTIHFEHPAQQPAFNEYRLGSKEACEQVERITQALRVQCEEWRMNPVVKALIVAAFGSLAQAAGLATEELRRYQSQVRDQRTRMSKAGQIAHFGDRDHSARRILVEAAWNNRFKAQVSRCLEVRQEGQPKIIRDISWKAQPRLSKRWRSLSTGEKLAQNKVCVAIARELSGFIWDVARHVKVNP